MEVITPPLEFETIQGAAFFLRYILLQNNGGGALPYNARVDYKSVAVGFASFLRPERMAAQFVLTFSLQA
ncbi:MAG: hypothetical protein WKF37_04520 [Bryobacteraceae bacterium]